MPSAIYYNSTGTIFEMSLNQQIIKFKIKYIYKVFNKANFHIDVRELAFKSKERHLVNILRVSCKNKNLKRVLA